MQETGAQGNKPARPLFRTLAWAVDQKIKLLAGFWDFGVVSQLSWLGRLGISLGLQTSLAPYTTTRKNSKVRRVVSGLVGWAWRSRGLGVFCTLGFDARKLRSF